MNIGNLLHEWLRVASGGLGGLEGHLLPLLKYFEKFPPRCFSKPLKLKS